MVLSAAVMFFAWTASQPPTPSGRLRAQPQQAVPNEQQQQADTERGTAERPLVVRMLPAPPTQEQAARENEQTTMNRRAFWLTSVVAIFSGGLLVVGFLQWKTYERTLATIKTVERAYVFPLNFDISEHFESGTGVADVIFRFKNSGKTPAFVIGSYGGAGHQLHDPPKWGPRTDMVLALRPNGKWLRTASLAEQIPPANRRHVVSGKAPFYIWGRIIYRDWFGDEHFTNFGMEWDQNAKTFRYVDIAGYNDAD